VDHYAIDSDMSTFTVRAFASGMLSALGHSPTLAVRDFTGKADFSPSSLDAAALHIKIKAGSLNVTNNVSDKDRRDIEKMMNEQVLEPAKYPDIVYEAPTIDVTRIETAVYSATLVGTLSFHGVTHNQTVSARIAAFDRMIRASGEFSLNQSDYGIKPISVAGGTMKVKDELKFSFEMVARKQE